MQSRAAAKAGALPPTQMPQLMSLPPPPYAASKLQREQLVTALEAVGRKKPPAADAELDPEDTSTSFDEACEPWRKRRGKR